MFRVVSIFLLLTVGLAAIVAPARHGWLPLWPAGLVEVVHVGAGGEVRRDVFEPVNGPTDDRWMVRRGGAEPEIMWLEMSHIESRNRPRSAAVVEDRAGGRYFGFLVGVRDAEGALLDPAPAWFERDYVVYQAAGDTLVVESADGERVELSLADVYLIYRPNRMGRADRWRLFFSRLRTRVADRAGLEADAQTSGIDVDVTTVGERLEVD